MDELFLCDLDRFSTENFIKVKKLLTSSVNETAASTTKSRLPVTGRPVRSTRSKQAVVEPIIELGLPSTDISKPELARSLLNRALELLQPSKDAKKLGSKTSKPTSVIRPNYKNVYELTRIALQVIYNERGDRIKEWEVEKLHLTFILRLVDNGMVGNIKNEFYGFGGD